jgi:hypothetical protein
VRKPESGLRQSTIVTVLMDLRTSATEATSSFPPVQRSGCRTLQHLPITGQGNASCGGSLLSLISLCRSCTTTMRMAFAPNSTRDRFCGSRGTTKNQGTESQETCRKCPHVRMCTIPEILLTIRKLGYPWEEAAPEQQRYSTLSFYHLVFQQIGSATICFPFKIASLELKLEQVRNTSI